MIVYVKWWLGQIDVAQFDNHTLRSTLIAGCEGMLSDLRRDVQYAYDSIKSIRSERYVGGDVCSEKVRCF